MFIIFCACMRYQTSGMILRDNFVIYIYIHIYIYIFWNARELLIFYFFLKEELTRMKLYTETQKTIAFYYQELNLVGLFYCFPRSQNISLHIRNNIQDYLKSQVNVSSFWRFCSCYSELGLIRSNTYASFCLLKTKINNVLLPIMTMVH